MSRNNEIMTEKKRLIPTGECWCGCKKEAAIGSFFARGHNKRAIAQVIKKEYGSVQDFLVAHGFGPGNELDDAETDAVNEMVHSGWTRAAAIKEVIGNR